MQQKKHPSKELLYDLYWKRGLSLSQIAGNIGYSTRGVQRLMWRLGLETDHQRVHIREAQFDLSNLNPLEIGYIVGFIDGDGCIALRPSHASVLPYVGIATTNKEASEFFARIFKRNIRGRNQQSKKGKKPLYVVAVTSLKDVLHLLDVIKPYLIVRKPQAEIVAEYVRRKLNRQITKEEALRLMKQAHELNRKSKDTSA